MRSNSDIWDFSQVLTRYGPSNSDDHDSKTKSDPSSPTSEKDVTIPKAMFDHLVNRAAEATLQHSQVKAAREELQKAYIKLASTRSATQSSSASGAQGSHASESRSRANSSWGQN